MTKQMPTTWKDTQNIFKQKIYTSIGVVNKNYFIYLAFCFVAVVIVFFSPLCFIFLVSTLYWIIVRVCVKAVVYA